MKSRPVWAEISLSALVNNLNAIRKYVNPPSEKRKTLRKILSIVKGNATVMAARKSPKPSRKPDPIGLV